MTTFDLAALNLGDVSVSGKGAKNCPFYSQGAASANVTLEPMPVCYEPSAYGDDQATRVNIVFRPGAAVLDHFEELDELIIKLVARDSLKFFGKVRSEDLVRESYQPLVKTSEKYPPQIKAKVNLSGSAVVRCWDADRKGRGQPETWRGALVKPRLVLKGLYFMGAGLFGATMECTDVQIMQEDAGGECPFSE